MLRITLLQTPLHWENAPANLSDLEKLLTGLEGTTDLVVLPEMFSTGFTMNAKSNAEPLEGPSMQWMRRMAIQLQAVVTGSLIIHVDGSYYNRLIWMQPDGTYQQYDKRHLFRLAGEEKTYTAGNQRLIFTCKGWAIFPLICYDLRFPVWSRRSKNFDYDLLLYVANWPERRNAAWKMLLPARAIENQSYVVAVNRVGADGNGILHSGDTAIYDFLGEKTSAATAHQKMVLQATLEKKSLINFRNQFPFWQDADEFDYK